MVDDLLAGGHDGRRLELVLLDRRRDGIEQIAEALASQSAADAIHLITHGSQAELQLGTARLTANSMFGEYADALSKIGLALTEGGDLLVYGCNFGRGVFGRWRLPGPSRRPAPGRRSGRRRRRCPPRSRQPAGWRLVGTIESAIAVSTRAQSKWGGLLVTPVIIARETVDSNANGQIDQIKITTDQNLDDDFAGLTITVSGYPVTGYTSDIANDTIFYVNLTESGSPDTGATPTVTVTANTTLSEDGGGNNIVTDPNWWNPAWQDRNKITFDNTNSAEDLIDFPVLVSLNPSDLPGLDLSAVVGADVRFIDRTTGAELKYEVEGWDGAADTATVWVKVPQIDGSSNTDHIWLYYNYNGTATYDQSAADEQAVWDPNYAGVWHLNEATGATVIDATSNANDGTPEAGPAEASTGKIGGALDFNVVGPSTRIEIPSDASLDLTLYTTWTMSAWVKPTSYVGTKWPTVYQYGSPGHATLGVAAQETTDGIIEHWQNDSTAVHGTNPATFNDWNHIAIVRDATNTTFYLNGSPDGSAASVTINDGEKSWIGGTENNSPGDDDFLGLIDEVRVSAGSNSDFSADWIKAQYLSTTGAFNTFGSEEIATDTAAPVIVSATSTAGSTTLTVTFSEPVDTSNAGAGDLVASDFSYTDVSGGGAASVSSMWTDTDGTDNVVTIAVNAAFNSDDFYTDLIAPASNQIYDLVDVAASTTAVAITTDISISSAANQTFIVGDPVTPAAIITITESATTATITRKNDLRIRIPASFNMTWDTSVTDVTIGGGAAGKVRTKLRKYEDADKTAVVDVSADFSVGDKITIDGLTVMSFVAPSPADNLELEVGRDGVVTAEDDKTITVGAGGTAVLSSGTNQIFSVGNPSTPMSPISVSDAATATITAANDIRIRIPTAFNMTWDSGITTATLGGSAAAKVNASVSFEDGDRTLVLNVNTDFADSDTLTISGLNYFNFTAVSTADNLELEIDNLGNVVDEDDKTIVVSDVSISSAAPQTFTVGDPSTAASTITITDGTSASIRKKEDLRIRIPAGVDMAWDTSVVSVTLGGAAAGKVKADLKNYEDNGKTAVIDIQDDFVGSDQFT